MTKRASQDEEKTAELVRQLNSDTTWLRHRGRAAELDRRLLQGATEEELSEVRVSWRGHITHLRKEHRVTVVGTSAGFWKITGSHAETIVLTLSPGTPTDELAADADYEDGEVSPPEASPAEPEKKYLRLHETARALSVLAKEDLLGNALIKASVGMLIRQASESNHWHNCAHYRSQQAADLIRQHNDRNPGALSTAAKYQAFCRSTLRHEHVVPNSVIYDLLRESKDHSAKAIADILSKYCIRATITIDEDSKLNGAGLTSSMPSGFFEKGDQKLFEEPLARYIAAGLENELCRLPVGRLWYQIP